MRILFVNNYYYLRGGSERVFFDEIALLQARGHEAVPFSGHFEKNLPSEYARFFAPRAAPETASLLQKLLAGPAFIYSLKARKKFRELLNFFRPEIIHCHNIYGRLTTSIIDEAKKRRLPVVMTLHDYKLVCPSYLMLSKGRVCEKCKGGIFLYCAREMCHKDSFFSSLLYTYESYFNRFLKKYAWVRFFICPSKFLLEKHATLGIQVDKLLHVPNFIPIDDFKPEYSVGGYILYVGRLSREKGILTLLKAVSMIDVPLRVVGDGPMRKDCETFVRENEIKDVIFEGYKTGDALGELFRNAACVVVPSECYENLPLTILESCAYGKPVIGSDIGGIPEMIVEGETGLLFKPGDYAALAEQIKYLFSRPSLITEMGKRARKRVEEKHNAEEHYQALQAIYERLGS